MLVPTPIRRTAGTVCFAALAALAPCVGAGQEGQTSELKQLKEVFNRLGSDDFSARQNAQLELQELATNAGDDALEQTLDKYLASTDPEVRVRLRAAMFNAVAASTRRKGFIGIQMDIGMAFRAGGQLERQNTVRVRSIIPGSAAESFGLLPGDEIIELDGEPFKGDGRAMPPTYQLKDYVSSLAEGDTLRLSIRRQGKVQQQEIKLGGMPDDLDPAFKEKAFDDWMHTELVERGLAKARPTILPSYEAPVRALPNFDPRVTPQPRVIPIPKENLFPEPKE